jgi:ribosomal protein L11 methyltransferase
VVLLAGMADEASARAAAAGLDGATVRPIVDDAWADAWRAWARPVAVGDVVVVPAWQEVDAHLDGATVVAIDPGRTFGSGAHETTRLALALLLEQPEGSIDRLLDVGCGSGVLGIAVAVARGVAVVGIDIEDAAVQATLGNAARNGVRDRVQASTRPLADVDGPFDAVVANILAVTLRELAPHLARVVADDGVVVLSGMLGEQVADVDAACVAAGLRPIARRDDGEWSARVYERSEPR